eukprot:scaffold1882_cov384-Prasinococcus_capsulatus_cf.AAC.1
MGSPEGREPNRAASGAGGHAAALGSRTAGGHPRRPVWHLSCPDAGWRGSALRRERPSRRRRPPPAREASPARRCCERGRGEPASE